MALLVALERAKICESSGRGNEAIARKNCRNVNIKGITIQHGG